MLSRPHRFHGHVSLNYVYKHGTVTRAREASVRLVRNARRRDYRVAVIVGRKVHKSAVLRNRVRRRIFEIVRTGTPIVGSYDIIITVFSEEVAAMPAASLQTLVAHLLRRAGAYRRETSVGHGIVKTREEG